MNAQANTPVQAVTRPDLLDRAFAAHARASSKGTYQQPSKYDSDVRVVGDKIYVVLRNINGTIKVYRVRSNGLLAGIERWPSELN